MAPGAVSRQLLDDCSAIVRQLRSSPGSQWVIVLVTCGDISSLCLDRPLQGRRHGKFCSRPQMDLVKEPARPQMALAHRGCFFGVESGPWQPAQLSGMRISAAPSPGHDLAELSNRDPAAPIGRARSDRRPPSCWLRRRSVQPPRSWASGASYLAVLTSPSGSRATQPLSECRAQTRLPFEVAPDIRRTRSEFGRARVGPPGSAPGACCCRSGCRPGAARRQNLRISSSGGGAPCARATALVPPPTLARSRCVEGPGPRPRRLGPSPHTREHSRGLLSPPEIGSGGAPPTSAQV